MSNGTRWTAVGVLLVINILANVVLNGTWYEIAVSALTGAGILALVVHFFVRGRSEQ
ncbi:hypothetical protein AGRA3207_004488 [Actinomadura graeca]|uniref:Uncharacterized protein n=1 Tax=Actinomadura graeca TaxID=2750812 RepID=A0ABX8QWX3_9ACTN|nr:hypothetical protein [Actinomadura graeca]QXJ23346.1 hypothetical protein AGRA3207_004488 [Actinomadura graeca]